MIFTNKQMPVKVYINGDSEKKSFLDILKDGKLYDKDTKRLLCPECNLYRVEFSTSVFEKYNKKWRCDHCASIINYYDYNIVLDDRDKYQIYKLWGVGALSMLTKESTRKTISFVASYFKGSCVAKKDKCPYFGFFKEKDDEDAE